MGMPAGIGVVDLMLGFPSGDPGRYDGIRALTRDAGSKAMAFPAEYMFREVPNHLPEGADPVEVTLGEMDRCGIAVGLIGDPYRDVEARALREHPDRFVPSLAVDPNDITGAVRNIRRARDECDIKAVTSFPAGCNPPVPVSDRRYYPVFSTCAELDIPIVLNAGVPGPRVPGACQDVEHFDRICYDFPELRVVMRHGAEPQTELAVKLMLKWPGLHFMSSGFAPRHYPGAIVEYANTRGADKVMYAGYYPMGLSLRRIFDELPFVPLKDEVWPKFLRDNARRVFGLGPADAA
jgi:uncharacterized protein